MGKVWRAVWLGSFLLACAHPSLLQTGRRVPVGEPSYEAWARLIVAMHQQLHPDFADRYLRSLESLPRESPLSNLHLAVEVELHLLPRTGELHRILVHRSSGVAELDAAAVAAFSRLRPAPFPDRLASSDGYAYLVWRLSRDPNVACNTAQARPYRLESAP